MTTEAQKIFRQERRAAGTVPERARGYHLGAAMMTNLGEQARQTHREVAEMWRRFIDRSASK